MELSEQNEWSELSAEDFWRRLRSTIDELWRSRFPTKGEFISAVKVEGTKIGSADSLGKKLTSRQLNAYELEAVVGALSRAKPLSEDETKLLTHLRTEVTRRYSGPGRPRKRRSSGQAKLDTAALPTSELIRLSDRIAQDPPLRGLAVVAQPVCGANENEAPPTLGPSRDEATRLAISECGDRLLAPTWHRFRERLAGEADEAPTVIHYEGLVDGKGFLFEDEFGRAEWIDFRRVCDALESPLPLLCLRSCAANLSDEAARIHALLCGRVTAVVAYGSSDYTVDRVEVALTIRRMYQDLRYGESLGSALERCARAANARPGVAGNNGVRFAKASAMEAHRATRDHAPPAPFFVGRAAKCVGLTRSFLRARKGVFVAGLPGIGKTSIIAEVTDRLACHFQQSAYARFGDDARSTLGTLAKQLGIDESPPALVRSLSEKATLLVIDNVDTDAPIDLVSLVRSIPVGSKILMGGRVPSSDFLDGGLERFQVDEGLDPDAANRFVRLCAEGGHEPNHLSGEDFEADQRRAWVVKLFGAHPRLLEVAARSIGRGATAWTVAQQEFLRAAQNGRLSLYEQSVRDMPQESRTMLSILGLFEADRYREEAAVAAFIEATGSAEDVAARALAMLRERSLIAPWDTFFHATIGEFARENLPLGDRAHARVNEALVRWYIAHSPSETLAWEAANLGALGKRLASPEGPIVPELMTLAFAVSEPMRSGGHWRALAFLLEAAVRVAENRGSFVEQGGLAASLGDIRDRLNQTQLACIAFERAMNAFERVGDKTSQAKALLRLTILESPAGDTALPNETRNRCRRVAELSEASGSNSLRAAALHRLAILEADLGNSDLAREVFNQALALVDAEEGLLERGAIFLGQALLELDVNRDASVFLFDMFLLVVGEVSTQASVAPGRNATFTLEGGLLQESRRLLRDAFDSATGRPSIAARINELGSVEILTRLTSFCDLFAHLAEQGGHDLSRAAVLILRGSFAQAAGDMGKARESYEASVEVAQRIGHPRTLAAGLIQLAWLERFEGVESARERGEKALALLGNERSHESDCVRSFLRSLSTPNEPRRANPLGR